MSASTCYAPLPALANKLLSGLRADDSVVSGDTHAHAHTRGEEACYDTSLEVNCSASVFGCPFARESWRGKKKEKKKEKRKEKREPLGGGRVAPIDLCKLNLSVVFVNGVRGNRFVAVVV